jgi:hypothetical protein
MCHCWNFLSSHSNLNTQFLNLNKHFVEAFFVKVSAILLPTSSHSDYGVSNLEGYSTSGAFSVVVVFYVPKVMKL